MAEQGPRGDFGVDAGHRPAHESALAVDVASRVQHIVASAERAASEMQREAEAQTRRRSADALAGAHADALRIRQEAEATAQGWLSESRERIDALTQQRIARIDELTHGLIAQCEAILVRFDAATAIRTQVEELLVSLGNAAEQLARESVADASISDLTEAGRSPRAQRGARYSPRLGWSRDR